MYKLVPWLLTGSCLWPLIIDSFLELDLLIDLNTDPEVYQEAHCDDLVGLEEEVFMK